MYDLTQPILDMDDTPVKVGETTEIKTLGYCLAHALLTPLTIDSDLSGLDKAKLSDIWTDKIKGKTTASFSIEELATLKNRCGVLYPQLIVGQVYKMLEKETVTEKEEVKKQEIIEEG